MKQTGRKEKKEIQLNAKYLLSHVKLLPYAYSYQLVPCHQLHQQYGICLKA